MPREDGERAVRLYVFDADGTLRRTRVPGQPSPRAAGEWELLPDVVPRLRAIRWGDEGARLGIASNQDQIAYGHLTAVMAHTLLMEMAVAATGHAPPPEAVAFCPHALEEPCDCRKPAPGLLLRIMSRYGARAAETLFVGDSPVDAEAARRAGVPFAWAHDFFRRKGERS
jgi:D-glycero-D-manno-heptose 1,7-bisphosphate phosphatase